MNLLSLPESYIFTQLSFINNKFNEKCAELELQNLQNIAKEI